MPKVDEVIERLRAWGDADIEYGLLSRAQDIQEAADLLASMKEALEPFANRAVEVDADRELVGDEPHDDDTSILEATTYACNLCVGDLRRARNALNGETP